MSDGEEKKKPRRSRGIRVVKILIPEDPKVATPVATPERLIDLGIHVDEEGRYKLRYRVDVPGLGKAARDFVVKAGGAQLGAMLDGLLGRKDEEE